MAGLPEHQEFLDNLWRFLNQIWQKEFPSPQLLEDFRRKSVVDGVVSLKKKLENLAEENAALQKLLLDMKVQESCNQFPIKQSLQPPEFRRLLKKHIDESIKLHEKIITLKMENAALSKEILDLKTQLEKHEEMARLCGGTGLNILHDFVSKKKEDNEHHLEELLRKLEDRERSEIAALNHKVNTLKEKLEAIHMTNVPFVQVAELQPLIIDVQIEIGKMREQLITLKKAAETKIEEKDRRQTQQLDGYRKQIEELKIELKERSQQKAALINQENVLKENLKRIEDTNGELVIQIADLQAQLLDKEREVRELNEDESRMRSVAEKCIEEKDGLIEKLNELKKQIAELKMILEKKSVERAEMNDRIKNLNEKVQLMKKTNHELGIQIANLQTQLTDKERQVYALREEKNRVESNAEKEIKNLKDREAELMKENEDLQKRYEPGCTREVNHMREQIIQLKLDNEKINKMKMDKIKENAKLQGVIIEKKNKLSRQNGKINDLRAEIRQLEQRTTKEIELQGDGLHRQIEAPKLDKNLQDKFSKENLSKEQAKPTKNEPKEETKPSEDFQNSKEKLKDWKKKIVEGLEKGLRLDQETETTGKDEWTV